ncbi:MAG: hypothetical protein ACYC56_13715, partial [Candidatus Aquicultor sp.]
MKQRPHQNFGLTAVDILPFSGPLPIIEGRQDQHGRIKAREKITEKIRDFKIFFRIRMSGDR